MAEIPNTAAFTVNDGLLTFFNVDTSGKLVQVENGADVVVYSNAGTTEVARLDHFGQLILGTDTTLKRLASGVIGTNSVFAWIVSGATPDPGGNGTINTGVGVARVTPVAPRAGIILQAGVNGGQLLIVQNEGTQANSLTFAASGTSNVADGAADVIPGGQSALFEWNSVQSLWFRVNNPLVNGTFVGVQSATAPDPGGAGTITTAGVSVARVSPAAARTGIILQAGTSPGQEVTIINEATAANSLTLNTTPATANVADSATEAAIAGLTARSYVWDSSTSLWYRQN